MFSQGYIGVTSKTAKERFNEHAAAAYYASDKRSKPILQKAIVKYGKENIIVDTICISELDYAYDLEHKLRPVDRIGWNTQHGGRARLSTPQYVKDKISKTLMGHVGVVHTEETKRRMSEKRKGMKRPPDIADKIRATLISRGPWNKPNADPAVWEHAGVHYSLYLKGIGYTKAANILNLNKNSANTVENWFKRGWVPFQDINWIEWVSTRTNCRETVDV